MNRTPYSLTNLLLLLATVLCFAGTPASAQEDGAESTTVVYPASYFAEYAPITAQDMLDRIPGLGSATGGGFGGFSGGGGFPGGGSFGGRGPGGGQRGLGDGGGGNQILINGKRVAGKSNQASSQLDRISASLVDYIEIIRGTSGELDIRGSGQVINVVLLEAYTDNSLSYEANMDRYWDDELKPGGSLAYSGQFGGLTYLFGVQVEPRYDSRLSKETSIRGDFSPNDRVREESVRDSTSHAYSANLGYEINERSSLRLNGLLGMDDSDSDADRWTTDLKVFPNKLYQEREDMGSDGDNWEIGGDYEYNFDGGRRFKVLFISNERNNDQLRERFVVGQSGETKNLFLDTWSRDTENIVRGSYTLGLAPGQDLESGLERAVTTLDSTLRLATARAGTPDPAYGGLVPVPVANANTTVEEIRYEPFLVHNWRINDRMSLESTLKYEVSEIEQSGDVYNKRDFSFLKPKLDYRFDLSRAVQLRATLEKTVSQLSFSDFVAASDYGDNDRDVQAGNVQLRQEEAWRYELNLEYRLPNDMGVLDGNLFYHDISNAIDRIDVTPVGGPLESASGNIGDGKRYGLRANASVRLIPVSLPNVLATARFEVQDSEVTDPFLGIERRMRYTDRGRLELGFRHDVTRWSMNWGVTWNNRFDGNRKQYDLEDIELDAGEPYLNSFVEYVSAGGLTFRLDGRSTTNNARCRERRRYLGSIADDILEEIEDQCSWSGRVLTFRISGTF